MQPRFYSKTDMYRDDHYVLVKRTPNNEFFGGYHYHDFFECSFYSCKNTAGQIGSVTIGKNKYPVKHGDIVLINAFEPHMVELNMDLDYVRHSVNFDLNFLLSACSSSSSIYSIFSNNCPNYPLINLDQRQQDAVMSIFQRIDHIDLFHGRDIYERALLYEMMAFLYDFFYSEDTTSDRTDMRYISLISDIVHYIDNNIDSSLSLNSISAYVNYSPSYVSRIFHKYTGNTLSRYISIKRIDRSKSLLQNPILPVVSISKSVGFESYNHFFRTFKQITGLSPTDYRASL